MAATWTTNLTLGPDNEFSSFVECCDTVGAYIIIVKAELADGCNAIFAIASANDGQKSVKKTVSTAGKNGEQLNIVWPEDNHPVLCYLSDEHAPQENRHFHLKIV